MYQKLNLTDHVDKWTASHVDHIENGIVNLESLFIESTEHPGCYYRLVKGETEWINPPMISGVEYRTTRRHLGSPVYCKVIQHTNTEAFGNDSGPKSYDIAHGISDIQLPVEIKGFYRVDNKNYTLPYRKQAGGTLCIGQISATDIVMQSYAYPVDAGANWRFEIYYIKEEFYQEVEDY